MVGMFKFSTHADAVRLQPEDGAKSFRLKGFADGDGRESKASAIILNDLGGLAIELQEVNERADTEGPARAALEFSRQELKAIISALRDARWLLPHPREKQRQHFYLIDEVEEEITNYLNGFPDDFRPEGRAVALDHRARRSTRMWWYWL